jgi:malonyl CoA-acyl carrier protein transacylase
MIFSPLNSGNVNDPANEIKKHSTLVKLLRFRAQYQPEQIAYIFLKDGETESGRLTYRELDQNAQAIAASLQSLVAPGERALLLYQSGLEFIAAFFGCLYAGIVAVPAYPPKRNSKMGRLRAIWSDSQAKVALTTQEILTNITKSGFSQDSELIALPWLATDIISREQTKLWEEPPLFENTLAFLQYTSGSTGKPKGVMVSHGNLLHNEQLIEIGFGHTEKTIVLGWLPLFHDMGLIGNVLQPLYLGRPSIFMPPEAFLQKPLRWLKAISHYQATTSGGPNFAYDLCIQKITSEQKANLDLSSWRVAFNGAEPVRWSTIEMFSNAFNSCGFKQKAFYPCYGMAEATLFVTGGLHTYPPVIYSVKGADLEQNQAVSAGEKDKDAKQIVGCGQTLLGEKLAIVNPKLLTQCQENQVGEIWVSSESAAQGYWNQPEQTEQTFHAFLSDTSEGPFLRTGDLGFIKDGELFVTGRIKDVMIVRGRNHYPQDIEMTVEKSHSSLRPTSGAAFSIDIAGEEKLVIIQEVERSYIRKLNANEVIGAIRRSVSEQHELEIYALLLLKTTSLPKTSSGKVQRSACRTSFLAGSLNILAEWYANPQNSTQFRSLEAEGEYSLKEVKKNQEQLDKSAGSQRLIQSQEPSLEAIRAWLIAKISEKIDNNHEIDIRQPLAQYGLDSLELVTISGDLQEWLGCPLSPTLLYDYPTIDTLSHYLALKTRISSTEATIQADDKPFGEAIAIIGMGCRFPGAKDPLSFWKLLSDGGDAVKELSTLRWDSSNIFEAQLDKLHTRWGGFLEQVDQFDPKFFSISPREANLMDPQQRLLLEVSWEALENAGQTPVQLEGSRTGVFIGISNNDYSQLQFNYPDGADTYSATGNAFSIAANRLSYLLDLRGPSWAVDTACSSSLVTVHQACQSLRQGECNLALAGGVNLILNPQLTVTFSNAGMIAADGRCKTFDAMADGYVRGEGIGVVVLKRLSDALKDGDNILALIRGSAVTQDGRTNGLTAPNGLSQQEVVRQALKNAGVAPGQISYVEAHGTGTSLGDPIEVNSLKEVLMQGRSSQQSCWIGSVKTNIGHLEAAAGIAGLIKTVLAMQNREIPPHLHLRQLNPLISLNDTPISIPTERQPWLGEKESRFAGISSFGFGGTNAHVVLEEAPSPIELKLEVERDLHILTFSAKSENALRELAQNFQDFLANNNAPLGDVCFSSNTGRSHFEHRLAIVAESTLHLRKQLEAFITGQKTSKLIMAKVDKTKLPQVAFLFTGQGSQYIGMGRQLYETQPSFRQTLDRCAEILNPYLDLPLLEVLYPATEGNALLNETVYSQPALFALEYALFQLWQSWGITPTIVMGHSLGEYVAACVAGVFSLEDGLKLVASRSRLMQELPQDGRMVAVFASQSQVASAIKSYSKEVVIAAFNGPESIVISGKRQAIQSVIAVLEAEGIKNTPLKVSHAFHSPLMEPMLADFKRVAAKVTYSTPQIELISNLTGQTVTTEMSKPEYWIDHVQQPVRFTDSLKIIQQRGCEVFVEIGPNPTLLGMISYCLPEEARVCLPSLRQGHSDWQQILQSLATLYLHGVQVDWCGFDRDYPRRRQPLPTYPFQRQRFWVDRPKNEYITSSHPGEIGDLLQQTAELLSKLVQVLNLYPHKLSVTKCLEGFPLEVKQPETKLPWLLKTLEEALPSERLAILITHIQLEIATVLHFSSSQLPETNLGFFDMGMDSLLAVELKNKLENSLGHPIPTTAAFNYPNIESLAEYLISEVICLDYLKKSTQVFQDDIVAKIEHLSDAEAEALLIQKLSTL